MYETLDQVISKTSSVNLEFSKTIETILEASVAYENLEKKENDIRISDFSQGKDGSVFKLDYLNKQMEVETNLYGGYNAINTSLSIAIALKMGVSEEEILRSCRELKITGSRFEKVEKDGKIFIQEAVGHHTYDKKTRMRRKRTSYRKNFTSFF